MVFPSSSHFSLSKIKWNVLDFVRTVRAYKKVNAQLKWKTKKSSVKSIQNSLRKYGMHIGIPMWTMLTYFLFPLSLSLAIIFFLDYSIVCHSDEIENKNHSPWFIVIVFKMNRDTHTNTNSLTFKSLRLEPIHLLWPCRLGMMAFWHPRHT